MSAEENKRIVQGAVDGWNQGDLEAYLAMYATDTVMHDYEGYGPGIGEVRSFYSSFWNAFPNSKITNEISLAEGDLVAARFVIRGRHERPFMAVPPNPIPPTGRELELTAMTILRFENGKCLESWNHADFLGMMQQLGVISPPGQAPA